MRRALVLVVVAAAAAVWAGLAVPSSALTVNAQSVSQAQLNRELVAIDASPLWLCYLQALAFNAGNAVPSTVKGIPSQAWSTPTTVEWTNQRTTQLAMVQFIERHDPAGLAPQALPVAQRSLETSITSEIAAAYQGTGGFKCSSKVNLAPFNNDPSAIGPATLASMPAWFQHDQVVAEAANLALVTLLPTAIPTSGPGLAAWYASRRAEFATVCFSYIALADQRTATAVAARIQAGLPFATAARRYSRDTATGPKGGVIGCFGPSSRGYGTVLQYTLGVRVGGVSQPYPNPQGGAWLFSVTRRTLNPLSAVQAAVAAAVNTLNGRSAALLATGVQRNAHVTVSSTIGTFTETLQGGTIVPPAQPPSDAVLNASANAPVTAP